MTDDHAAADLLELVLATRPDRVTSLMLGSMDAATRAAYVSTNEAIAALALAMEPSPPAEQSLRARIVASAKRRAAEKPRKAILVVDMINDHLVPGKPLEVPRARDVVPALAAKLDEARAAGVPVVYVLDRHDPDDLELDAWGSHAVVGTEGAEVWPPLAPKPGDRSVTKPAISGFYASDLEKVLEELRVDTLVLTGCATEVQLMATATDALQRGFAIELPPGLHAGTNPIAEQVTMGVLAALAPYQPARKARMERIAAVLEAPV